MDATWRELPRDNLVIVNEKKKKKRIGLDSGMCIYMYSRIKTSFQDVAQVAFHPN